MNLFKKMKNSITLFNTIINLFQQILVIVSALIIPKIILEYLGSNVNGLVSSISQFLSYIYLVEGGVTGVITASLYKPLYNKDYDKISSIFVATKKFYKKIAIIFVIYTIILASFYPIIFNTDFTYIYVFLLTIILSLNLLIQYLFSLSYKVILLADKKNYIVSLTHSLIIIINILLAYLSVSIYPNIHLLKIITSIVYLIQPIIYSNYVVKHYNLNKKAKTDMSLLKSRWDGLAINIAMFIHFSTDIVVLTIFTDLKKVSVYSVFTLVTNGLRQFIAAISSAISPSIGLTYASGNKEAITKKFNTYEFLIFILSFTIFSVAILLILPFVMIYTKNVVDNSYYYPVFGVLVVISEFLYSIYLPHQNLAFAANKFKEMKIPYLIEALLNIIISILLVKNFGLIGVSIGTIIAMLYGMIYHSILTKKILDRPISVFYKKIILFLPISLILMFICYHIGVVEYNIINWLMYAFIYTIIFTLGNVGVSFIFYKEDLTSILNYLFKIKKRSGKNGK